MSWPDPAATRAALARLQSQLAEVSEQEKVHEGQLEETLQRLEDIRSSKRRLRLECAHLANRYAPVSVLPDEILATIFGVGRGLQVRASHVIRRWRDVATNTPLLWTKIICPPYSLDQAETYLERSRSCSLDILLYIDYPDECLPEDRDFLLDCILPHVERWRNIEIIGWDEQCVEKIIKRLLHLSAPRLQRFMLNNARESFLSAVPEPHQSSPVQVFTGGASALERLKFTQLSMAQCWPPLAAVTELFLCDMEPLLLLNHFHDALAAMPRLTILRMVGQVTEFPGDSKVVAINIPSLIWLHIDCMADEDYSSAMFATLCTPSLRSLTLNELFKEDMFGFVEHLRTPSHTPRYPTLKSIEFRNCGLGPDFDLISLLPTITHFSLDNCFGFVDQLTAKSSGLDGHLICPHLHTLTLGRSSNGPGLASVCKLISVRKSINLPITTLRLVKGPHDRSHFDWLRDNVCLEIVGCEIAVCLPLSTPTDFSFCSWARLSLIQTRPSFRSPLPASSTWLDRQDNVTFKAMGCAVRGANVKLCNCMHRRKAIVTQWLTYLSQ